MEVSILTLPAELLVTIVSYLSSRDKVQVRYVSQRFIQIVSETPSLWREIVWEYYDTREELCLMNVLKMCGKYINRLAFPGYLTPKLDDMLQHCNNVRHISLPVVMTLSPDQLTLLREAVQHMKHLHTLEVGWDAHDIKPLLSIGSKLQKLTLYVREHARQVLNDALLHEWIIVGFRPSKLNIVFTVRPVTELQDLMQKWHKLNTQVPASHDACLTVYSRVRISLNLAQVMPTIQLCFGQSAVLPLVQAKQCSLQGLGCLLVSDCCRDGNMMYKATTMPESFQLNPLNYTITGRNILTHFNITKCSDDSFLSSHLEQLAFACPNLQQLMLRGCRQCFTNLQGLRSISSYCHKLRGLNLVDIPVTALESQIKFWEILTSMKLTHLIIDFCIISPLADNRFNDLFEKCSSLLAIEIWCRVGICKACSEAPIKNCLLLSHFPSLLYCKMFNCCSTSVQDVITSCKELKCCRIHFVTAKNPPLLLSLAHNVKLQQLCIHSSDTVVPDTFMSSVSAHGGLVHVFLSVSSVSVVGISMLIENSPKLMTFQSLLEICDKDGRKLPINEFLKFEMILKQKFHCRKLFHRGGYAMLQRSIYHDKHLLDISYLEQTDVYYLWDVGL